MKIKRFTKLFTFFFTLLIITGCNPTKNSESANLTTESNTEEVPSFEGVWTLKTLNGDSVSSLFVETYPNFTFDLINSQIAGNGGCNNFSAGYLLSGDTLIITTFVITDMSCDNLAGEKKLREALSDTSIISIKKDLLKISKKGSVVIEAERS